MVSLTYITEFGKVSEFVEQDFLSNLRADYNITNLYVSYMVNSRHTGQHTYKKSTSKG